MKFPYIKFGAKTPESGEYASFRPVIPIQVRYRDKVIRYMALLDSGADVSMFHAEMTEVLGIDLKSGTEMVFYGILGQEGFFEQFNIKFNRSEKQIELNHKQAKV